MKIFKRFWLLIKAVLLRKAQLKVSFTKKNLVDLKKVHSALTKGAFYTIETHLQGWEA